MKTFLRFVFNFFWFLLVGLWSAISNLVLGIACCITIIGIPFGLQYFKFIKLVFAPAGKIVGLKYTRHPIMNTIWLILGGFAVTVSYYVLGVLFLATIIGAPIARQLFKIANFNFAPFGAEVLCDGEYSKKKNLSYDYKLLMRRIARDPEKMIGTNVDGTKETALQRLKMRQASFVEVNQKIRSFEKKESIVIVLTVVISLVVGQWIDTMRGGELTGFWISDILFLVMPALIVMIVFEVIKPDKYCVFYEKLIGDLMEYYPIGSPEANSRVYTFEQFVRAIGVIMPMNLQNGRLGS